MEKENNNIVEEISIGEKTIYDFNIELHNIFIVTSMKVGTTNFSQPLFKIINSGNHCPGKHTHDLNSLKYIIDLKINNKLIITSFRNPLDRNISYFFDTIINNSFTEMYLCKEEDLCKYSLGDIINHFNEKICNIEDYYKKWHDSFFKLTNIDINLINKKGIQLFKINNNTYILLSILEKYENNIELFNNFLTFKTGNYINSSDEKLNREIISNFKKNIKFDNYYKDKILSDDIIKKLYNEEDIEKIYRKYINDKSK